MGLSRHSLGQQGLARSGRAHQQRALGKPGADFRIFPGIVEEVHHLHQGLLGLVLTGHVLEGDSRLLLHVDLGVALAHAHGAACAAHLLEHHAQQNPHQQHRQHHVQQYIQDAAGIVAEYPGAVHAVGLQPGGEGVQVLHDDGGVGGLRIAVEGISRHRRSRLHGSLDPLLQGEQHLPCALHLHGLHLIRVDVFQELGIADLLGAAAGAEHQVPEHEDQQDRAQSCQQYHHEVGPPGGLVTVPVAAVPSGHVAAPAVVVSSAIVILVHLIVHNSSVSSRLLFCLFVSGPWPPDTVPAQWVLFIIAL